MTNDETNSNAHMTNRQCRLLSSFGFCHSFVLRHLSFVIVAALTISILAAPPPSAKEILGSVRMLESRQQIDLQGQLRQNEIVVPFRLTQTGPIIRYSFTNPEEVLQLRLGENNSRLDVVTSAGTEKLAASKLECTLAWRRDRTHPALLEAASASAIARVAILQRRSVDRRGERRAHTHGRL
jgi:hypothetical protein